MDHLTPEEEAHALQCGWILSPIYLLETKRWVLEIFPSDHPATSVKQAQAAVTALARNNDLVAIHALQLVVRSLQKGKK